MSLIMSPIGLLIVGLAIFALYRLKSAGALLFIILLLGLGALYFMAQATTPGISMQVGRHTHPSPRPSSLDVTLTRTLDANAVTPEELAEAVRLAGRELVNSATVDHQRPHRSPLSTIKNIPVNDRLSLVHVANLALHGYRGTSQHTIRLAFSDGDYRQLIQSTGKLLLNDLQLDGHVELDSHMVTIHLNTTQRAAALAQADTIPLETTNEAATQGTQQATSEAVATAAAADAGETANSEQAEAEVALSPLGLVQTPADVVQQRPEWTARAPRLDDDQVYRLPLVAGPFTTLAECEAELARQLQAAANDYIDQLLGAGAHHRVGLTTHEIRHHAVGATMHEEFQHPEFGKMHSLHALLQFTPQMRERISHSYRQSIVNSRIALLAIAAAFILGLLGTAFAYLKLDTLTRGYYRTRLRLAVVGTWLFIGVAALGVAVWTERIW